MVTPSTTAPQGERLQKLLSQWGVASRRQAEAIILAGRVRVNGEPAHLGQRADPHRDRVEYDGRLLNPAHRPDHQYFLLHKPLGVVSTCTDPEERTTVLDLLPPPWRQGAGIHPVGRLDVNSSGALVLTNDGDLTFRLTHPSHPTPKTYRVWVEGHPRPQTLERWQRGGLILDGRPTLPAQVQFLGQRADRTLLEIILWEGRNRQIRRIADQIGHPVLRLHRIAIGSVFLGDLSSGNWRNLTKDEVDGLKSGHNQ